MPVMRQDKKLPRDRRLCEKVCLHVFKDCDCVWLKAVPSMRRTKTGEKCLSFKSSFFWQDESVFEMRDKRTMLEDCFCLKLSDDVCKMLGRRVKEHGLRGLALSKTGDRWRQVREDFGDKLLDEIEKRDGKLELVTGSGRKVLDVKSAEELLLAVELDDV